VKIILILLTLLACQIELLAQKNYTEFEEHLFIHEKDTLPYRLLVPKNYSKNKKYPLVVFYHGAGERGTDNKIPLAHIAGLFLDSINRHNFPCFVLIPQCPKGKRWVEVDWGADSHTQPEQISTPLNLSLKVVDHLKSKYKIDKQRIYVTGLSMGGYAVWDVITRCPELFACAVPICGGGDETKAEKIKDLPIWAFHGALDKVVKPHRSRNMIEAIKKLGGKPQYTEYENVQHGSWKNAYSETELLKWMFSKKK
jgi:predicted peptidase